MKQTFDSYCETSSYAWKFHLQYHLVEAHEQFGKFWMVPRVIFNVHMKCTHRNRSYQWASGIVEIDEMMYVTRERLKMLQ